MFYKKRAWDENLTRIGELAIISDAGVLQLPLPKVLLYLPTNKCDDVMKYISDAMIFIEGVVTPKNKTKDISIYYRDVFENSRLYWGWKENGPRVRFAREVIDIFTGNKLP